MVFDRDRGVCQMCHVDAHALHAQVKRITSKAERKEALLSCGKYKALTEARISSIIRDPVHEGDFWEANHKEAPKG